MDSSVGSTLLKNQMQDEDDSSVAQFSNMMEGMTIMPGSVVVPGSFLTSDTQRYLHGHGTIETKESNNDPNKEFGISTLRSTQAGILMQLGSLLSVQCVRQKRYEADVGDVVVGRVLKLNVDSWALDVGASQDAILRLSSVNLPTVQRRKTYTDQLQMRNMFQESDLIVSEVLEAKPDRRISLQTRSSKYGKLGRGLLVTVDASLMRRQKQHFWIMDGDFKGIRVILSMNGMIWIDRTVDQSLMDRSKSLIPENNIKSEFSNQRNPASEKQIYDRIARVRNAIVALYKMFLPIHSETILDVLEASKEIETKDMTENGIILSICSKAISRSHV